VSAVCWLEYFQRPAPASLLGKELWKKLRTIGNAVRTSRQGDKETTEVRYFISSLRLGVRHFARSTRAVATGALKTVSTGAWMRHSGKTKVACVTVGWRTM